MDTSDVSDSGGTGGETKRGSLITLRDPEGVWIEVGRAYVFFSLIMNIWASF